MPTAAFFSTPTVRRAAVTLWLAAGALALGQPAASAAEIKVLTSGAFKPVVVELANRFTLATGTTVKVDNDTAGALARRMEGGESFDLLILPPAAWPICKRAGGSPAAPSRRSPGSESASR